MKVIIGKRRSGKTTKLIRRCAEEGGTIVCLNQNDATRIADMARGMELQIPLPITYNEFRNGEYYGAGIKLFHMDNVEMFLQSLTPVRIATITLTDEEECKTAGYDPYYDETLVDKAIEAFRKRVCEEEL